LLSTDAIIARLGAGFIQPFGAVDQEYGTKLNALRTFRFRNRGSHGNLGNRKISNLYFFHRLLCSAG
jgi:hypothetical protein